MLDVLVRARIRQKESRPQTVAARIPRLTLARFPGARLSRHKAAAGRLWRHTYPAETSSWRIEALRCTNSTGEHVGSRSRLRYEPIVDRPHFSWPGDATVALWVIPNIEYYPFDAPGPAINERAVTASPDVLNSSWREYGPRVGMWRLFDCLDAVGVPVAAALNSEVCDIYPRLVEEGVSRGWEWIAHGTNNSARLTGLSLEEEQSLVTSVVDRISGATGRRPRGWLGPGLAETEHTPETVLKAGLDYVCDWIADDLPIRLDAEGGHVWAMPYSIHLNDMELLLRQRMTGPSYFEALTDAFEQLRREGARERRGRVMAIPLHPFLTGHARYVKHLQNALEAIAGSRHTWPATGAEILDHYAEAVA